MIQDIGNKLEAKIDKLQETRSKEREDLGIKRAEMQNTITEVNSLEATTSEHRRQRTNKQGRKQTSGNH